VCCSVLQCVAVCCCFVSHDFCYSVLQCVAVWRCFVIDYSFIRVAVWGCFVSHDSFIREISYSYVTSTYKAASHCNTLQHTATHCNTHDLLVMTLSYVTYLIHMWHDSFMCETCVMCERTTIAVAACMIRIPIHLKWLVHTWHESSILYPRLTKMFS